MNYYTYCNNNPLAYDDPTGHWPKWLDKAVSSVSSKVSDVVDSVKSAVSTAVTEVKSVVSSASNYIIDKVNDIGTFISGGTTYNPQNNTSNTSYTPSTDITLNSVISKTKSSMTASLKNTVNNNSEIRALTPQEQVKLSIHNKLPLIPFVNIANDFNKAIFGKDLLGYYNLN